MEETTNSTAMIQKRIWLLRVSAPGASMVLMIVPPRKYGRLQGLIGQNRRWQSGPSKPKVQAINAPIGSIETVVIGCCKRVHVRCFRLGTQQVEERRQRGIVIVAAPGRVQLDRGNRIGFHR